METLELAHKIIDAALNRHAYDILLLDISRVCTYTDYFILCSGESERQLRAISEEVDDFLSSARVSPRRYQGTIDSGWIILDLGDIVVHILTPQLREYYALEEMWRHGNVVVRIP